MKRKPHRGVPLEKILRENRNVPVSVFYRTERKTAVLWAWVAGVLYRTNTRRGDPPMWGTDK